MHIKHFNGVGKLSDSKKKQLCKHKIVLRRLINGKSSSWKTKKRATLQNEGSFFQLLVEREREREREVVLEREREGAGTQPRVYQWVTTELRVITPFEFRASRVSSN